MTNSANSTRGYRIGFILIATSCFLIGFLTQIFFLSKNQHDYPHSSFRVANNIEGHLHGGLEKNDLQRLLDIERKFAQQLTELENLKQMIKINKMGLVVAGKSGKVSSHIHFESPSYSSSNSALFLSAVADDVVPNIVRSWRNAKLDWHSLLPVHNSIWERYGTPEKGKGLRLLVSKEIQVTNFLTQFHESGLSAKYGKNHGALSQYSGCNSFQSTCMVHDIETCTADELCSWSIERILCVDRENDVSRIGDEITSCDMPKTVSKEGTLIDAKKSDCKFYVNQPAIFITIDSESQSMFYHWWASWSSITEYWTQTLHSSRKIHFFLRTINDPMFFDFFGFLSDNCWRRSTEQFVQVPQGACFCNSQELFSSQTRSNSVGSASQIIKYLDLEDIKPPLKTVKIGIISRRLKRFILNEYELVAAVEKMGYLCVLLPLEMMTIHEQMKELKSLDVLIGIHGSALDNSVFLHEGTYTRTVHNCPSSLFFSSKTFALLDCLFSSHKSSILFPFIYLFDNGFLPWRSSFIYRICYIMIRFLLLSLFAIVSSLIVMTLTIPLMFYFSHLLCISHFLTWRSPHFLLLVFFLFFCFYIFLIYIFL